LEVPGSCPGILSQAPRPLPAGAESISNQHTFLAADAVSKALGCVPAAKFTVDHTEDYKF